MSAVAKRNHARILLAFAAVYVLWGSTYLGIRYAVETIPPFVMGAGRFIIAGVLLHAYARWRGAPAATAREWRTAAITGVLMLAFGNGAVIWSEQTVPSGVVALLVASVPLWIVLVDWLRPHGVRPRRKVFIGLTLGLIGIATLVGPQAVFGEGHISALGAAVLMFGSISWAVGSVITRTGERPRSALVSAALQMIVASAAFFVMATVTGELRGFIPAQVSMRSLLGVVYLVIFGSLLGYTAYVYLLGAVSAAKAATYAYVNPVIAVLLGWAFAGEAITARTLIAAAIILAGVAIITGMQSVAQPTGEYPIPTPSTEKARSAA